ncbi:MAG: hypothetical protein JXA30_08320, partial [Deltaproteobacteria bacterium]|nr:hypothetical protein [Deltaproteobacteria bacterium]
STILAGTAGALGFTGELAADLFAPLNAYTSDRIERQQRPMIAQGLALYRFLGRFLLSEIQTIIA